jgi:hypothetical protein
MRRLLLAAVVAGQKMARSKSELLVVVGGWLLERTRRRSRAWQQLACEKLIADICLLSDLRQLV